MNITRGRLMGNKIACGLGDVPTDKLDTLVSRVHDKWDDYPTLCEAHSDMREFALKELGLCLSRMAMNWIIWEEYSKRVPPQQVRYNEDGSITYPARKSRDGTDIPEKTILNNRTKEICKKRTQREPKLGGRRVK